MKLGSVSKINGRGFKTEREAWGNAAPRSPNMGRAASSKATIFLQQARKDRFFAL